MNAFGAITAGQVTQQAKAGLEAVYPSAGKSLPTATSSETMYPDQSLYAYDRCRRWFVASTTFKRADEIQWSRGIDLAAGFHRLLPAHFAGMPEADSGGVLNAFGTDEEHDAAGAAGVHF